MEVPGRPGRGEKLSVEVEDVGDGLVIYQLPWDPGRWTVALASNGWRVTSLKWESAEHARRYAEKIASVTDWHAEMAELVNEEGIQRKVLDAAEKLPGRVKSTQPRPAKDTGGFQGS